MQGALAAHESKLRFSYIILPHGGKIKCFALLPRFFCGAFRLRGASSAAKPRSPLGGGTRRLCREGFLRPSCRFSTACPFCPSADSARLAGSARFPGQSADSRSLHVIRSPSIPAARLFPQPVRSCRQPALNCPRPPADIFLLSAYARRPSHTFPRPRRPRALRTSRTNPLGGVCPACSRECRPSLA